nr:uncharacterized protein [Tanacetum cinerariifolium]
MDFLLGIHRVRDVVDPGSNDVKKNNIVKGLLFQVIPEDLVLQIKNLKIRKEMWDVIKTRNLGADCVKEARLQTLITEFKNSKMSDNDNIDTYAAKLSGIASKSAILGEVMSKHKPVKKFLTSLPRYFVHIVAALEQVLDLKTTRKANPIAKKVAGTVTVNNDGDPLPGGGGGVVPPELMVGGEVGLELGDEVGGHSSVGVMGGVVVIDGGVEVAVGGGDVGVIGVVDGGERGRARGGKGNWIVDVHGPYAASATSATSCWPLA